jgi:putative FmdB family regulatory protein
MPIYEFYCPRCHALYDFLSKSIAASRTPRCPKGGKDHRLERQVSLFAQAGGRKGDETEEAAGGPPPADDARMERAMGLLEKEAGAINEEDPRQAAALMRKFSDMSGLQLGRGMEQALSRLEAGEDPDAIEKEMGDLLDGEEEPFSLPGDGTGKRGAARRPPPHRDPTLYDM